MRLAAAIIVLFAALFAPAQAQNVEGVAAIVNDQVITTYDLRQRMRLILASTGVRPDQELIRRVQAQALRTLIDESLQLQEAATYEVEVSEEEVREALERLAAQNEVSVENIAADLAAQGVGLDTLEQQLRSDIAWQTIVNGRYRQRLRVSDDQIDNRLERLAASASRERFLISEILIDPPYGASDDEIRAQVEAVIRPLQQGAPFPAVAAQFSAAPSAVTGGDVGWVMAGEIREELERALRTMEPGQISPPIETAEGVYILALRDRRAGADLERLALSQILLPVAPDSGEDAFAAAAAALSRERRRIDDCEDVGRVAARIDGAISSDLGAVAPSDLAPAFRNAVAALSDGETTEPIRAPAGVVLITLCGRELATGGPLPSRDEIENRIVEEQLSLHARRYLRDLRRDATIETRLR